MKRNKLVKIALVALSLLVINPRPTRAEEPLNVVATLSTFGDIAKSIGGDNIKVSTIAPPTFNPHFIEARPTDILKVKKAELFIHGGLDLEAWRGPLVNAAGNVEVRPGGERELDLSKGITLLNVPTGVVTRAQGDIHMFGNPHYWTDPRNGLIIARSIAAKLSEVDPTHAASYQQNLTKFESELSNKIAQWQTLMQPFKGAEVIGYHDEWVYLMNFSGLQMNEFLEPKPGIPPTPKQLELLRSDIKQKNIRAIIQATFYPKDAGESLQEETGAKLLLLCQNVGETDDCDNYTDTVNFNLQQIAGALGK